MAALPSLSAHLQESRMFMLWCGAACELLGAVTQTGHDTHSFQFLPGTVSSKEKPFWLVMFFLVSAILVEIRRIKSFRNFEKDLITEN